MKTDYMKREFCWSQSFDSYWGEIFTDRRQDKKPKTNQPTEQTKKQPQNAPHIYIRIWNKGFKGLSGHSCESSAIAVFQSYGFSFLL